jgi:hypothetical protein
MTGKRRESHLRFRHESKALGATLLADLCSEWTFYDVIGVDEGQFFEDV